MGELTVREVFNPTPLCYKRGLTPNLNSTYNKLLHIESNDALAVLAFTCVLCSFLIFE